MKMSTKGRYGVRLMFDLALHAGQVPVTLKDIAARQEISEKYLSNIIPLLKNAGLVNSVRGSQGGYSLARPPREITLKDILLVLEGSMCLVECTEKPMLCQRSGDCPAREVWSEVAGKMLEALESFTLESMVERRNLKNTAPSYSI
ncbi:MAG TPA: Rrf2 family transcriptional regulator [Syntrophobacteraceae bacterium]|nr:Rrf2 family transcriptional regulator [Syntrophobacteraceae bacterium]